MKISQHFNLNEFISSKTASKMGIDNTPNQRAIENIKNLTLRLLEPLRLKYNSPLIITSGFRSIELNRAVGGVNSSQHTKGEAADISCKSPQNLLQHLKSSSLEFDQAILYPTFLHLSLKRAGVNRKEVIIKMLVLILFSLTSCTKPIYLQGKSEYIEKVVMKDTTIYIDIERQVTESITEDSSFLETPFAFSSARIDSLGSLHHSLEQKQAKIEKIVQYQDKIITIRDSIPYPQVIKEVKQVKHIPTAFWISMIVALLFIAKTLYKLFKG